MKKSTPSPDTRRAKPSLAHGTTSSAGERFLKSLWGPTLSVLGAIVATLAVGLYFSGGSSWVRPMAIAGLGVTGLAAVLFSFRLKAILQSNRKRNITQRDAMARSKDGFRRLTQLFNACQTLPLQPTQTSVHNRLAQICFDKFECDQVTFMAVNNQANLLEVVAASGKGDVTAVMGRTQELGEGVAGFVAESGKPLLLGSDINTEKFWQFQEKIYPISAAICVPVKYRDEVYGVLNVSRRGEVNAFTPDELKILEAAVWYAALSLNHLGAAAAEEPPQAKAA